MPSILRDGSLPVEPGVQHGQHQQRGECGGEQAADHDQGQGPLDFSAGSGGKHEGDELMGLFFSLADDSNVPYHIAMG